MPAPIPCETPVTTTVMTAFLVEDKEARPETRSPCQGEPRSFGFASISSANEPKTRHWPVKKHPGLPDSPVPSNSVFPCPVSQLRKGASPHGVFTLSTINSQLS